MSCRTHAHVVYSQKPLARFCGLGLSEKEVVWTARIPSARSWSCGSDCNGSQPVFEHAWGSSCANHKVEHAMRTSDGSMWTNPACMEPQALLHAFCTSALIVHIDLHDAIAATSLRPSGTIVKHRRARLDTCRMPGLPSLGTSSPGAASSTGPQTGSSTAVVTRSAFTSACTSNLLNLPIADEISAWLEAMLTVQSVAESRIRLDAC